MGERLAIREIALMDFDGADRVKRLRIAASAVVDFLCADHKVSRAKVFSRWRSPKAVLVRRITFAALRRAGYGPHEIRKVFGCDITTVLRSKDIEREPPPVLEQLRQLIQNPPPFGPDTPMAPLPELQRRETLRSMRKRYRRLVDEMLRSDHRHAVVVWRAWCRSEYPFSWKKTVRVMPREYRLRFPDRLALAETGGSETGGPVQFHNEDHMGPSDEANGGERTSGQLQRNAQAA